MAVSSKYFSHFILLGAFLGLLAIRSRLHTDHWLLQWGLKGDLFYTETIMRVELVSFSNALTQRGFG